MQQITELLAQKISENRQAICDFFKEKFTQAPAIFYNSVDLRHSSLKIAPVDTNCFPAGFNNLSDESKNLAKKNADEFLNQHFPGAKKILLIPENHTRNLRYLENVKNLEEILSDKREVRIASVSPQVTQISEISLEDGRKITLYPLQQNQEFLTTIDGFQGEVAILNNDLSDGIPQILAQTKTAISPSVNLGWHSRSKSNHFDIYNQIAVEISQILQIDPWLISSLHTSCDNVDFKTQQGMDKLAKLVDELLEKLRQKYQEYGIDSAPYCYIKADSGTYGMGVWPVFSRQDVLTINKKERGKMSVTKGSVENHKVIIQEGILTSDKINNKIAEPMIYLVNGKVVGNLFRVNENRDEKISLNAAGASFFDLTNLENSDIFLGLAKDKIDIIYCLISKMAALAAAIENSKL
jgi:glutamate--cysteine ligase